MFHEGTGPDILYFLGMNPGYEEDLANEPFIGPSGKVLRTAYMMGLESDDSYPGDPTIIFGNTARCMNKTPAARHFRTCFSAYGLGELKSLASQTSGRLIVCALGANAVSTLWAAYGRKNISLTKGLSLQCELLAEDTYFFCTYHPAFILRQRSALVSVADHMALLSRLLADDIPVPSKPHLRPPQGPPP